MPKSEKKILNPNDFLLPFKCSFPQEVDIYVSSNHYHYIANKDYELSLSEFEAIRNSHYGELLKPFFKK